MSEAALELFEKVMALAAEDRRAIAEELYVRVLEAGENEELFKLAEERWAHLEKNPTAWMSHEDVMKSLRR